MRQPGKLVACVQGRPRRSVDECMHRNEEVFLKGLPRSGRVRGERRRWMSTNACHVIDMPKIQHPDKVFNEISS